MKDNATPHFAANAMFANEAAVHIAIDILVAHIAGFGLAFIAEADKLLDHRMPTPAAQTALQAMRDHVAELERGLHGGNGAAHRQ